MCILKYEIILVKAKAHRPVFLLSYLSFYPWLCTQRHRFPPLFGSSTGIPRHCDNPKKKKKKEHKTLTKWKPKDTSNLCQIYYICLLDVPVKQAYIWAIPSSAPQAKLGVNLECSSLLGFGSGNEFESEA